MQEILPGEELPKEPCRKCGHPMHWHEWDEEEGVEVCRAGCACNNERADP